MVRWLGWLGRSARAAREGALQNAEAFRALIDRERRLCDRSGSRFVVCALELPPGRSADVVVNRVRASDSVGWLAGGTIGILLRHCPQEMGVRFAEELCGTLEDGAPASCVVYPYPPLFGTRLETREPEAQEREAPAGERPVPADPR